MQSPDQYLKVPHLDSGTAGFAHFAGAGIEEAGGIEVIDTRVQEGETDRRLCWQTILCVDPI